MSDDPAPDDALTAPPTAPPTGPAAAHATEASIDALDSTTRTELEAAAFRTLVAHLRERTDVQNIDLMNLAGFCRNCLSKYYVKAAQERGLDVDYEDARTHVYGMPYTQWKQKHQTGSTPEQQAAYTRSHG